MLVNESLTKNTKTILLQRDISSQVHPFRVGHVAKDFEDLSWTQSRIVLSEQHSTCHVDLLVGRPESFQQFVVVNFQSIPRKMKTFSNFQYNLDWVL